MPGFALATGLLAVLAFTTPLWAAEPERLAGLILSGGVVTELLQGLRRRTPESQQQAWSSAAFTLVLALVLLNAPWLAAAALAIVVTIPFLLDALRHGVRAVRELTLGAPFLQDGATTQGNLAAVTGVILIGRRAPDWIVGVASGVRLVSVAVNIATTPTFTETESEESVIADLDLPEPGRLAETGARLQAAALARLPADRGWTAALIAVLFAIHVGRMGFDRSALGVLSPLVAVLGDVVVAFIVACFMIVPVRLIFRRLTRPLERRAWQVVLDSPPGRPGGAAWTKRAIRGWLESRLRFAIRLKLARFSLRSALGRGLQVGLPFAAVLTATAPFWGMSWYFDTENWAAGIWNSWAAARTDTWREAMVRAVVDARSQALDGTGFAVTPAGVDGSAPFSFIVIGDTGEGDASQHVLRDSLLRAAAAEDVRFVVISSDVIYPTGAMKDYESRFWLPFKGVTKPVYAIPGNHDWYDALEGFVATFFDPDAARLAMRARIAADGGISSTTDARIEEYLRKADFLRTQYGVPTGYQQAPFFQIRTPRFVLLAVDTGVIRRVDPVEMAWLRGALEASRGRLVMAVIGHPFFAGGNDTTQGDEDFGRIRSLLRDHGVRIIMAGDTHDLEYYREPVDDTSTPFTMHHWVNGGGGAYMSFGTALSWPGDPVTTDWAFYPDRDSVVAKIDARTPWWKRPVWFWTDRFGAWPWSAEWLSAMFDDNVAPFFQSFVVVTVDPAVPSVTIRPWGIRGPLTWGDFARSERVMPAGASLEDPVAWVIP